MIGLPGADTEPQIEVVINPELQEGGQVVRPGWVLIKVAGFSSVRIANDIIHDRAPAVSRAQHVLDLWKVRKGADVETRREYPMNRQIVQRVADLIHDKLG